MSEASRQAAEEIVHRYWDVDYDDSLLSDIMHAIDTAIARSVKEFARLEDIDSERVDNFLRAPEDRDDENLWTREPRDAAGEGLVKDLCLAVTMSQENAAELERRINTAIAQAVEGERAIALQLEELAREEIEMLKGCLAARDRGNSRLARELAAALRAPSPLLDDLRKLGSSEYIIRTDNSPPEVTG